MMFFYSELIWEHFNNPQNAGKLDNPSVMHTLGNPHNGAVIQLQLLIENNTIEDIKFKAYGAVAIASMSYLTEKVKGLSLDEAMKVDGMLLVQELNVNSLKLYNCLLAVDVLQESIIKYSHKKTNSPKM